METPGDRFLRKAGCQRPVEFNDLTQFTLAVSRDDAEVGFLGS